MALCGRGKIDAGVRALVLVALIHSAHPARAEDHSAHTDGMMPGVLGPYPITREASGTSWQPDSSPHHGNHWVLDGGWTVGAHAMVEGVYDHQGGRLGDDDGFSNNMFMAMAQGELGPGRLGFRSMLSLEAATNDKDGYPLLLQTGETADGKTPLVDRQHPHDLFMELAAMYGLPLSDESSVFVYFGLPGEPAIGPTAFMHRFSGMDNPEAPISHHWLDSTHITYGVATIGTTFRGWKVEASAFNGREPDEDRYDIEEPKFDSYAGRIAWNPSPDWSLQFSGAHLESPEQLHPLSDTNRFTFSVTYNRPIEDGNWQTMFAWGQNDNTRQPTTDPFLTGVDETLNAFLLESAVTISGRHTFLGRAERLEVDELFEPTSPLQGLKFTVGKISLGYIYDVVRTDLFAAGIGALGSVAILPSSILRDAYGDAPLSGMFFVRMKVG